MKPTPLLLKSSLGLAALFCSLSSGPLRAAAPETAHGGDWEPLHRLIQPAPQAEGWRSIPWRTDLWEARREAARTGKPLFLWEMDGHPLGCT